MDVSQKQNLKPVNAKILATDAGRVLYTLSCSSCLKLCVGATQCKHGCRLCELCRIDVSNQLKTANSVNCPSPSCVQEIAKEEFGIPDFIVRKTLEEELFHCLNENRSCEFTGTIADIQLHLATCEYQDEQCRFCAHLFTRKDKPRHEENECELRLLKCQQCHENVTHLDLHTKHFSLSEESCCKEFQDKCPYCDLEELFTREQLLDDHVSVCPGEPRSCSFSPLGCTFYNSHDRVLEHEAGGVVEHLDAVMRHINAAGVPQPSSGAPQQVASTAAQNVEKRMQMIERRMKSQEDEHKKQQQQMSEKIKYQAERISALECPSLRPLQEQGPALRSVGCSAELGVMLNETELNFNSANTNFWCISDFREKHRHSEVVRSPVYYVNNPGQRFQLLLYLKGDGQAGEDFLSLHLIFLSSGSLHDQINNVPFEHVIEVSLHNVDRAIETHLHGRHRFGGKSQPEYQHVFSHPNGHLNSPVPKSKFARADQVFDEFLSKGDFLLLKVALKKRGECSESVKSLPIM